MRLVVFVLLVSCAPANPAPIASPPLGATPPVASVKVEPKHACPHGTIEVPGGAFTIGATKEVVTVTAHCIDRTEVSVAFYAECVSKGACTTPDAGNEGNACNWKEGGHAHPINCIDHAQAIAYCAFIGGRLPTEAEWEWSARGYEAGTIYPWGNNEPIVGDSCWATPAMVSDFRFGACPIGSFKAGANPKGVLDLAGNVSEWTSTESDGKAIVKGGDNEKSNAFLTAKHRDALGKTQRSPSVGFRCVRTPGQ